MCSCSNKPTQVCAHVLVEWGREIYITCWIGFYTDILTLDNPRTEEAPQRNWVNPGRMSIRGHSAWSSLQLTSYLEEFQRQWVTSRGYQRATSPMAQSVMVKSHQSVHGGGLLSTSSCITHVISGQSSFSPRTHMPPHTHIYMHIPRNLRDIHFTCRNRTQVAREESHWETDSLLGNSRGLETKQSLYLLCSDLKGNFRNQPAFTKYFLCSIYSSRESSMDNNVYFCHINNSMSICYHGTQ